MFVKDPAEDVSDAPNPEHTLAPEQTSRNSRTASGSADEPDKMNSTFPPRPF
jgi:hypothetical protein